MEEIRYKQFSLSDEFLPVCFEKLNSCYNPEPTVYETWIKPILWIGLGAGAVLLIKK